MPDKYAILGSLRNENLYGYEISKKLKDIEGFWYFSPGNLYRALSSLERDGQIVMKRTEESEGRVRKIYSITEKGKKDFDAWIMLPASLPKTRHEAFLKIWLAAGDSKKIRIQLEQMRDSSVETMKVIDSLDLSVFPEPVRWMMESGKMHMQADVEWSQEKLGILDRREKEGARE